jgi:putative membrane protein
VKKSSCSVLGAVLLTLSGICALRPGDLVDGSRTGSDHCAYPGSHPASAFPTPLAYRLIFIHCLILMLGGHYTYAQVPLGFWVQDLLDLGRNHYDRLGHLAQGFIPAIIVREVLLRTSPLRPGKWLFFLVICVCLAVSASYEFVEWWAALLGGEAAEAFLGTQGDPWDTQWDMFLAFVGAMTAQLLLGSRHDRDLAVLNIGRERAFQRMEVAGGEVR